MYIVDCTTISYIQDSKTSLYCKTHLLTFFLLVTVCVDWRLLCVKLGHGDVWPSWATIWCTSSKSREHVMKSIKSDFNISIITGSFYNHAFITHSSRLDIHIPFFPPPIIYCFTLLTHYFNQYLLKRLIMYYNVLPCGPVRC